MHESAHLMLAVHDRLHVGGNVREELGVVPAATSGPRQQAPMPTSVGRSNLLNIRFDTQATSAGNPCRFRADDGAAFVLVDRPTPPGNPFRRLDARR
jgi:hypothetical protein